MTERRACGCNDFSRTELARRAVAEAGRGLPPIEPGMPLPAGTGLSRRSFLSRAAGLALAVYGGSKLVSQAYDDGIARAAAAPADAVLISIFLEGGADALSILFPDGDPRYRVLRPKLALPASSGIAFSEDARLFWHPSLASLATLHAEGKVTVMPAIGYTSPDQSHFTSRHYWEVGATDPLLRTGWLGRYLDRVGTQDNPLQGLSLFTRAAAVARDLEGARRVDRRPGPVLADGAEGRRRGRGADGADPRAARQGAREEQGHRLAGCRAHHLAVVPTANAAPAVRARERPDQLRQLGHLSDLATTSFRAGWPGWRQCSRWGCLSAASRSRLRACTTRTPSRPTS